MAFRSSSPSGSGDLPLLKITSSSTEPHLGHSSRFGLAMDGAEYSRPSGCGKLSTRLTSCPFAKENVGCATLKMWFPCASRKRVSRFKKANLPLTQPASKIQLKFLKFLCSCAQPLEQRSGRLPIAAAMIVQGTLCHGMMMVCVCVCAMCWSSGFEEPPSSL